MFSEHISKLMQELQPEEPVSLSSGQTSFGLEVDDTRITLIDEPPGMRVESTIGQIPTELADRFMAKMLQGNFLGQMTRKSVLGLDEEGKNITLQLHLPVVKNYREFHDQLEDFINTLVFWKGALAKHPAD